MLTFSNSVEMFLPFYFSETRYEEDDKGIDARFIFSILIICLNFLTRELQRPSSSLACLATEANSVYLTDLSQLQLLACKLI